MKILMKYVYTSLSLACYGCIIILIFPFLLIGQDSIPINKDIPILSVDTSSINYLDEGQLDIPNDQGEITKVILAHKEAKYDLFDRVFYPILMILIGAGVAQLINYLITRKHINRSGLRWVTNIYELESDLEDQIFHINEFIKSNDLEIHKIPRLPFYSSLKCESFHSMDKSIYFKYLLSIKGKSIKLRKKDRVKAYKEAVKAYNKAIGYTNVLSSLAKELKSRFEKFENEIKSLDNSFHSDLISFKVDINNYLSALEKDRSEELAQNESISEIKRLTKDNLSPLRKEGTGDVFVLKQKYFIPVHDILIALSHDDRAKPLFLSLNKCMLAIDKIIKAKRKMSIRADQIAEQLKSQLVNLSEVVNHIER